MDKPTRNLISNATQAARRLLEGELAQQLEGVYDILSDGSAAEGGGSHLGPAERLVRDKIVAVLAHKRAGGKSPAEAVDDYLREAAFTCLNRFVALKMLEARELVPECVSRGDASRGFREFGLLAQGLAALPDKGYRLYIESLFDELSTEIKVLFDRHDPASLLWPRRQALADLLEILNASELAAVWGEDETIGWVYQYFNSGDERKKMREESPAPRNSRELAVRNQFFTPRYVVQFLTDNTLGRIWYEMRGGDTALVDQCAYLVRDQETVVERPKKDPRDIRLLDPAGGSGHFLLYAFDLFLVIYEEAWHDDTSPGSKQNGRALREDYPDLDSLRRALPALILRHNLHAVDIDPRCVQIAALALWMRAQRAYKDFGHFSGERAPITVIHVIVAEPMPGDEAMVSSFADSLEPPLLGTLFKKMVGEMRLAGELGTLLRVEDGIAADLKSAREQFVAREKLLRTGFLPGMEPPHREGELDLSGIDDAQFFHHAEPRIVEALRRFAEVSAGGTGVLRRLFAGDAGQGVALIDLLQNCYDVVLMNPPFGLATSLADDALAASYPNGRFDLGAAFVERALEVVDQEGVIGVIANRTLWFGSRLEPFRKRLIREHSIHSGVDLGLGVLDAFVETGLLVLGKASSRPSVSCWIDATQGADRAASIRDTLKQPDELARKWKTLDFELLNGSTFAHWIEPSIVGVLSNGPPLSRCGFETKQGLATMDNERFLRLWYEVPAAEINKRWFPYAKGGNYAPIVGDLPLVVDWGAAAHAAYEIRTGQFCCLLSGQANNYTFRPGITYSTRTSRFSARLFPQGALFDTKGSVIFDQSVRSATDNTDRLLKLCLDVNTPLAQYIFDLRAGASDPGKARDYTQSMIAQFPWSPWVEEESDLLEMLKDVAKDLLVLASVTPGRIEYTGILNAGSLERSAEELRAWAEGTASRLEVLLSIANNALARRLLLQPDVAEKVASAIVDSHRAARHELLPQYDTGDVAAVQIEGMLGYAFNVNDPTAAPASLRQVREKCSLSFQPPFHGSQDPGLEPQPHAVLVDDAGHPDDLGERIREVARTLNSIASSTSLGLSGATTALDPRCWPESGLFDLHLQQRTKAARKAPVFWQLATTSGDYSVWLYYHRLTSDTFFKVLRDFVMPKVQHEERNLTALTQEAGPNPSSEQRKEIAGQEAFVEELRSFRDEVVRIAPLWSPDLNDGVIINFAPLWRLVPHHRQWQKECKDGWDKLVGGECDWAHLAMHLWPERVVPKCAFDHSLAISHGLEQVFWEEDEGGKWQPRRVAQARVEELVQERTSRAVKAALQSLLDAPSVASGRGPRVPRRQPSAPPTARAPRPAPEPAEAVRVARGPAASGETLGAVRDAIAASPGGASRADVIASTGVSAAEWNAAISALLEVGAVVKTGEKRGTRYYLKGGLSA